RAQGLHLEGEGIKVRLRASRNEVQCLIEAAQGGLGFAGEGPKLADNGERTGGRDAGTVGLSGEVPGEAVISAIEEMQQLRRHDRIFRLGLDVRQRVKDQRLDVVLVPGPVVDAIAEQDMTEADVLGVYL